MFNLNKFKDYLQERRLRIKTNIDKCIEENTEFSTKIGKEYEIQLFEIDTIMDVIDYMENNDI